MPPTPDPIESIRQLQESMRHLVPPVEILEMESVKNAAAAYTDMVDKMRPVRDALETYSAYIQPWLDLETQIQPLAELGAFQDSIRQLVLPFNAGLVREQLQDLSRSVAAGAIAGIDYPVAKVTAESLNMAVFEWVEVADEVSRPELVPTDAEFGWIDLLPAPAQLKLLITTLDILNAVLFLAAHVDPAAGPPLTIMLAADVLIRLARALQDRLY
jgi:hypothetical protein